MNRATHMEARTWNGEAVKKFYNEVLTYFIETLEKEYRYKPYVTTEHIEALH
jgi:predicted enzyme related to lactoylglutathione lyase